MHKFCNNLSPMLVVKYVDKKQNPLLLYNQKSWILCVFLLVFPDKITSQGTKLCWEDEKLLQNLKESQRIQWVLNPGLLGDSLISSPLHHSFLMVGVGKIYTNVSHIVLNNKKLLSFFWIHVPKDEVIHGISQSYAVPCTREIYILRYQNSTHVEPRFFYLFGIFPCNTGVQKCEP